LINPRDVVLSNVEKRYLLELDARGVPVVPTLVVERGAACELTTILRAGAPPTGGDIAATSDLAAHRGAASIVIKPEVGAASLDARRFAPDDPAARAHLAALTRRGAALVQPYLASVETYGERSLVWIDGTLSHAIRKMPRLTDAQERVAGAVAIASDERAVAEAALASVADRILYGRVDLARDDAGQPRVMELELIEPSLYFTHQPGSADRFVSALRRHLEEEA
jgi:O-ureido-D-serine cyclo-ligase